MLSLNSILSDRNIRNINYAEIRAEGVPFSSRVFTTTLGGKRKFTPQWRTLHTPGLHPAFRPQEFDLGLHEGFQVVLTRQRVLALQLVAAQLHPHQVAQQ